MAQTGERRAPVAVKLTTAEIESLDEWAEKSGLTRSDMLRAMLDYATRRLKRAGRL